MGRRRSSTIFVLLVVVLQNFKYTTCSRLILKWKSKTKMENNVIYERTDTHFGYAKEFQFNLCDSSFYDSLYPKYKKNKKIEVSMTHISID